MIERLVRLHIADGHEEEFVEIFQSSQAVISHFEGCRQVRLLRSPDEPGVFFTQSLWDSAAALENYRKSDFFRQTWGKTKSLFDSPASAWSLEVVEDYL